jgi:hypothetical protein
VIQPMQQQNDDVVSSFESSTREIRVRLTKVQIELLVNYALRNGYQRSGHGQQWDIAAQNQAAKWAIMSRLGFEK